MKMKRFCSILSVLCVLMLNDVNTTVATKPKVIPSLQIIHNFSDKSESSETSDSDSEKTPEQDLDISSMIYELQGELEPIIENFKYSSDEVIAAYYNFESRPYKEQTIFNQFLMCTNLLKKKLGDSQSTAYALSYMLTMRNIKNKILVIDLKNDFCQRFVVCYEDEGQSIGDVVSEYGLRVMDFIFSCNVMKDLMYSLEASPLSQKVKNQTLSQMKKGLLCTPIESYLDMNKNEIESISVIYFPEDDLSSQNINCSETISVTEREECGGWPQFCNLCKTLGIML